MRTRTSYSNTVTHPQARVTASAYGVAASAEEIGLRAIGAYLEVPRRQETVAASLDNVDAHKGLYWRIKSLSDEGAGRRVDVDQAQSRRALAEASLRAGQADLGRARAQELERAWHGLLPGLPSC